MKSCKGESTNRWDQG